MLSHPDADAFIRGLLAQPTDSTARLVFADWLEETGEPHSAAWAHFIRLKIEADRYPHNSAVRYELDRHAGEYALQIRAALTVPAKLFVGYPKSLLQLLPATNLTVRFADFEIPQTIVELMPESVARENRVLPLDLQGRTLLAAAVDPNNTDTTQKLEFILNKDVILVGATTDDMQQALDRHFPYGPIESVSSYTPLLTEFTDTATGQAQLVPPPQPSADSEPIVRLVNLILQEAIALRADGIRLIPDAESVVCSYFIDGAWVERDHLPLRLLRPVTARLALIAWLHVESVLAEPPVAALHKGNVALQVFGVRHILDVTITSSPHGPATDIVLRRAPVSVEDR
jgi:type IV pilus assembly protein PilB